MPEIPLHSAGRVRRHLVPVVVAVIGAAVALAGVLQVSQGPAPAAAGPHEPTPSAAVTATVEQSAPDRAQAPAPPAARRAPWVRQAPRLLTIPGLEITASVLPVRTAVAVLTPPSDATTLGWWADGAAPGAARGSVLVAGHTVRDGVGAFNRLGEVRRGGKVTVRTAGRTWRYTVASVRVLSREQIADRAPALFRQRGPHRLVLLTCTDWDGSGYRSNVVVTAVPAASPDRRP